MNKFEIGDKVKIISKNVGRMDEDYINKTGYIVSIKRNVHYNRQKYYVVKLKKLFGHYHFLEKDLMLLDSKNIMKKLNNDLFEV